MKIAQSKQFASANTKVFLDSTGQKLFRTVDKSWKNQTVWSQRNLKNIFFFRHNSHLFPVLQKLTHMGIARIGGGGGGGVKGWTGWFGALFVHVCPFARGGRGGGGGGLKLFGQCRYRPNKFRKGASLTWITWFTCTTCLRVLRVLLVLLVCLVSLVSLVSLVPLVSLLLLDSMNKLKIAIHWQLQIKKR